jgi:hypothetical protein
MRDSPRPLGFEEGNVEGSLRKVCSLPTLPRRNTDTWNSWNTAVTKHLLAADPSYVACLNSECGVYFSAEGCGSKHEIDIGNGEGKGKSKAKKDDSAVKAVCPHCDHELCLSCKRPWHLGSCNSARKKEDEESEKAIKNMGAKQCPKCGVNIEKQGGCDHMTCKLHIPPLH